MVIEPAPEHGEMVYELESIGKKRKRQFYHARRIQSFDTKSMSLSDERIEQARYYEGNEHKYEEFVDIWEVRNQKQIKIVWEDGSASHGPRKSIHLILDKVHVTLVRVAILLVGER